MYVYTAIAHTVNGNDVAMFVYTHTLKYSEMYNVCIINVMEVIELDMLLHTHPTAHR